MLQPKQHILLYQCELNLARQLLQLCELTVGLGEERFLVFLASESEKGSPPIIARKAFFCDRSFAVGEDGDAFLVLVYLIALVLEVEDCPVGLGKSEC